MTSAQLSEPQSNDSTTAVERTPSPTPSGPRGVELEVRFRADGRFPQTQTVEPGIRFDRSHKPNADLI
jgi:hypothetical protein